MVLSAFFMASCEKAPERIDDFFVHFATVVKQNETLLFQLDNNKLLFPKELKDYKAEDGQRVVINYVPLKGDTVKIRNVSNIFTGAIDEKGYPEKHHTDPVKIQSVWVSGHYLNMILEVEYHSKPHTIGLLRDTGSGTADLYFSHSANDDPPGYPKKMYASFSLQALRKSEASPIPFRVFIQTHQGLREFEFELK